MADALYCGRRFRTFNVIDDHNREALDIEIDTSITGLLRIPAHRDRSFRLIVTADSGAS